MRIKIYPAGVQLWASANDTYSWANRAGASWPGTRLAARRFFAEFDTNGLVEITVDGRANWDVDAPEFNAIVSDLLRNKLPQQHPVYFVTVGQFEAKSAITACNSCDFRGMTPGDPRGYCVECAREAV